MNTEEIKEILRKHGNWLRDEPDGVRAVLSGAVLRGADLRGAVLRCAYLRCADLRGAVLRCADLRCADLRGADLSGAVLRCAVLSGAVLRCAYLRCAVLSGAVLRGADLSGAVLRCADLSGADLRGAVLRGADLSGADLSGADLRGAVLRCADIPKIERLHTRIADAIELGGVLDMESWHTCETTHCRAGWAIHIAGEAGKKLEGAVGSAAAGALIFAASYPDQRVPNFYTDNETALADIKRRADEEKNK